MIQVRYKKKFWAILFSKLTFMGRHRILEVGPGITPMHYRSQGERSLKLNENEDYTGLDQPHAVDRMAEHEVWKKAKEQYGDRALVLR